MTEQRRLNSCNEETQVSSITCGSNLIKKETNFRLDFNNSAAFDVSDVLEVFRERDYGC